MSKFILLFFVIINASSLYACPDKSIKNNINPELMSLDEVFSDKKDVIRVEIAWIPENDSYQFSYAVIEKSGTEALLKRTKHFDSFGSYRGILIDPVTKKKLYYNSLGTGQEYRKLTRSLTFRFPIPSTLVEFQMIAENPQSGVMEKVLTHTLDPEFIYQLDPSKLNVNVNDLEVRLLQKAKKSPKLIINIYAEGYSANRRDVFWKDAPKVVESLMRKNFPMIDHFEFRAVFSPSKQKLGEAKNLGFPIPERDSFLGLYYPYWNDFGRWYHIVYPTRESHYRQNIGLVPYDYAIVLVDSSDYWGVGNFKELTAIPADNSNFTYLLMHEIGHFFGLNEEYDTGGKTELAFAPGIREPWSPNITFANDKANIKWKKVITKGIPIPTPKSYWNNKGPYGLYRGGYAQTEPLNRSYKPGLDCIMDRGANFCEVCKMAITKRVYFDLGLTKKMSK